jgi:hypothetical protein
VMHLLRSTCARRNLPNLRLLQITPSVQTRLSHRYTQALPNAKPVAIYLLVSRQRQQIDYTQGMFLRNCPAGVTCFNLNLATAIMTVHNLRNTVVSPRLVRTTSKVAVGRFEEQQKEHKDEEREREHGPHRGAVVLLDELIALFYVFRRRIVCCLRSHLAGWSEFAVARAWGRLVEIALCVAEGVALRVGVVAYALHTLRQAVLVLECVSIAVVGARCSVWRRQHILHPYP